MNYGSVCSGIEAASCAWHSLGWTPAWFAEIEPFPSAVLAHHYPAVPNLGDMTTIAARVAAGEVEAPDVLVGGTPCQAFSVAGLRGGLSDARGQLTLSYVELANAIDAARAVRGDAPAILVWENVPGVLSSKDNAFGCFLGALAGEDCELKPPGRRWSDAGCVFGPQRAVAWRILDAQYLELAQRRRRVFVVASARDGFDPASVLFEFEGLRRDSPPSREPGQSVTGTLAAIAGGSDENDAADGRLIAGGPSEFLPQSSRVYLSGGVAPALQATGARLGNHTPQVLAYGGNNQSGPIDVATARNACASASGRMDFESETFLVQPTYAIQAGALRTNPASGPDGVGVQADVGYTLEARAEVQCIAFQSSQSGVRISDTHATLDANNGSRRHNGVIAFDSRQDPVHSQHVSGALGSSLPQAQAVCVTGDVTHTLRADGFDASEDGTERGQPIVASFHENSRAELRYEGGDGGVTGALKVGGGKPGQSYPVAQVGMAVRRLMPVECERLQGFPDDYTRIPVRWYARRKVTKLRPADQWERIDGFWWLMSADGPRYKALGNSMAVPCMHWIGRRIDAALRGAV